MQIQLVQQFEKNATAIYCNRIYSLKYPELQPQRSVKCRMSKDKIHAGTDSAVCIVVIVLQHNMILCTSIQQISN